LVITAAAGLLDSARQLLTAVRLQHAFLRLECSVVDAASCVGFGSQESTLEQLAANHREFDLDKTPLFAAFTVKMSVVLLEGVTGCIV